VHGIPDERRLRMSEGKGRESGKHVRPHPRQRVGFAWATATDMARFIGSVIGAVTAVVVLLHYLVVWGMLK
jgi:hypothetical protein